MSGLSRFHPWASDFSACYHNHVPLSNLAQRETSRYCQIRRKRLLLLVTPTLHPKPSKFTIVEKEEKRLLKNFQIFAQVYCKSNAKKNGSQNYFPNNWRANTFPSYTMQFLLMTPDACSECMHAIGLLAPSHMLLRPAWMASHPTDPFAILGP